MRVDDLVSTGLCQAHQPPQRHAENDRDNRPGGIGERHRYDLAMREELASRARVTVAAAHEVTSG
jgi:hypothetical protein